MLSYFQQSSNHVEKAPHFTEFSASSPRFSEHIWSWRKSFIIYALDTLFIYYVSNRVGIRLIFYFPPLEFEGRKKKKPQELENEPNEKQLLLATGSMYPSRLKKLYIYTSKLYILHAAYV